MAAFPCALVAGFVYAYPTYSNALQSAFNLTETEKETIGLAPSLCNLVTFTSGLLIDQIGLSTGCFLGGLIMTIAFGLFGGVAQGLVSVAQPATVFFIIFAAGNYGISLVVCAVYTTLAKAFPDAQRSEVVSMTKAWQGVAAGVGTAIFVGLHPSTDTAPERLAFLYFLALAGLVPMLLAPVLRPLPTPLTEAAEHDQLALPLRWRLPLGFGISALLIVLTLASTSHRTPGFATLLLVLLLSPLLLLAPRGRTPPKPPQPHTDDAPCMHNTTADAPIDALLLSRGAGSATAGAARAAPWEGGPCRMARRVECYLLWLSAFALQGGGIFLTVNLGSMVQSRGEGVAAATAVTVFSCAQAFARLVTGSLSNVLVRRGAARTWYLVLLHVVMALGHGVLSLRGAAPLLAGTALVGWGFGSIFPLLVLTVAELFGTPRLASNYTVFDGTPGAVGALLFAKLLCSAVYAQHADGGGSCHGIECFRLSHEVVAAAQLVAAVSAAVLSLRIRVAYPRAR